MNKQKIGRILAIVVVTIGSAIVCNVFAKDILGWNAIRYTEIGGDTMDVVTFLGGVFGFWLTYTGRLARMFRKV